MGEIKVIYHVDDEETPYMHKLSCVNGPDVTLGELKERLNRPHYKYFFETKDEDFGTVKEELTDDAAPLPLSNGRVICWLELSSGSVVGGGGGGGGADGTTDVGGSGTAGSSVRGRRHGGGHDETSTASDGVSLPPPGEERSAGVGDTRPPSFQYDALRLLNIDSVLMFAALSVAEHPRYGDPTSATAWSRTR